jgi:hypothetical protein
MRRIFAAALLLSVLPSCVTEKEKERKPVGPVSQEDTKPWNGPIAGQGGGVLSGLPQTPRR